jgi:hypothetical protein
VLRGAVVRYALGAAGHSLRVPETGLESMSLLNLLRRIKLAAKLSAATEITKVFLPSGALLVGLYKSNSDVTHS